MLSIRLLWIASAVTSIGLASTISATSATGARTDTSGVGGPWADNQTNGLVTIRWTSGENAADTKQFCQPVVCQEGLEPKFGGSSEKTTLTGRKGFGGFDAMYSGDGADPSISNPKGRGSSKVSPCPQDKTKQCGTAEWDVTATGTLGSTVKPRSWVTKAEGKDPWPLMPDDFVGFGPDYGLWVPLGITGADFSPLGSVSLGADYQTSLGTLDLLHIGLSAAGAAVQGGAVAGIEYFLLDDILEGPTMAAGTMLTASQIQDMLNADLAGGDTLHNALLIGIYVPNLPVPTVDLGDGSVAAIHINADAFDQASAPATPTPEPASWGFALIGVALLAASKLKFS